MSYPNVPPMLGSRTMTHLEKSDCSEIFIVCYINFYRFLEVCGGQETFLGMSGTSWTYFTKNPEARQKQMILVINIVPLVGDKSEASGYPPGTSNDH